MDVKNMNIMKDNKNLDLISMLVCEATSNNPNVKTLVEMRINK
jgi:hypothetical protein